MSSRLASILIVFVCYRCVSQAAIQVLTGPSTNETWYCTSMNRYLGPQPDSKSAPVVASLHFLIGDPCDADDIAAYQVKGKAVFIPACICPEDTVYTNLASKGAAAVIRQTTFIPGSDYNTHGFDSSTNPTKHRSDMLYVQVSPDAFSTERRYEGELVRIVPDPNIWIPWFQSYQWQLLLRWIPGLIFALSSVLSLTFLIRRSLDDCQRYYQQAPASLQNRQEACRFALSRAGLAHFALLIDTVKCPILAFILMYGGMYSTTNLPDSVQRFFVTQLSGWTFVVTMISARTWYRATYRHATSKSSWLGRLVGDSSHTRWFLGVTAIPFTLDFAISVMYVLYIPNEYPILDIIDGGIVFVVKVAVGALFMSQSFRFLVQIQQSAAAINQYASHLDIDIRRQLLYQSVCAIGVGLGIAVFASGTLVVVLAPDFFSHPAGYMTAFALMTVGHAIETFFQIIIFRPVSRSMLAVLSLSKQ